MIQWQQFGLKGNPYAIMPLTEGGSLPIEKAFIGRTRERAYLTNLFMNTNNLNMIIAGDVGVGKTSLVNFIKYTFKYIEKQKPLFSFRREIEIHPETMNKRAFLLEIIGSVLREIHLVDSKLLSKDDTLKRLQKMVDIQTSINFSAGISGGFESIQAGIDFGRGSTTERPSYMPMSTLEQYFIDMLTFIRTHKIQGKKYHGLIIHVNNFDALLQDAANKKRVIAFFHEIRDLLQTPHAYSLFLGPSNFYKDTIASQQRISGIFVLSPLLIAPLSNQELTRALDERLKLFQSDTAKSVIKPFDADVIRRLYELYQGDIRSILNALQDILGYAAQILSKTFTVDEALVLLGRERWNRIELLAKLTPEQKEILKYLASANHHVTQKELVASLHKTKESMSGYYFKALKERGIIEEKKKTGTTKFWGLTDAYYPIRFLFQKLQH